MSNPVSASNAWSKIQKKITAQAGDVSGDATPEAQTPKATPAKKRAAGKKADGESPTKKTKTPSKGKKVKEEPVDDGLGATDGDEDAEGEAEQSFF